MKDHLRAKIHNHTAVGAVIGLGYVGLLLRHGSGQALAVAFAEKGFPVTFVATQCRGQAAGRFGESVGRRVE